MADTAGDTHDQMKVMFFQRINDARKNPTVIISQLGMDVKGITSENPDLTEILLFGLPALKYNHSLAQSAQSHTDQMLAYDFFQKESVDGTTLLQRAENASYIPITLGEIIGLVAFNNYMAPDKAVNVLFENLIKQELSDDNRGARKIFNTKFAEVGIGINAGVMTVGGRKRNVYVYTCDFGRKIATGYSVEDAGKDLVQLINQARSVPKEIAKLFGINYEEILKYRPELTDTFNSGLPPLSVNDTLNTTAKQQVTEMAAYRYSATTNIKGETFLERIRNAGYDFADLGERADIIDVSATGELRKDLLRLFRKMFLKEMTDPEKATKILNPNFTEIGIGVDISLPNTNGGDGPSWWMSVCDFGRPFELRSTKLIGLLYEDIDENGFFSPGEGISNKLIYNEFDQKATIHRTDSSGGFELSLGDGVTKVVFWSEKEPVEYSVDLGNDNFWFEFQAD